MPEYQMLFRSIAVTPRLLYTRLSWIVLIALTSMGPVSARIRLPGLVGDNMILQRDAVISLWGWSSPGEIITISFKGKTYSSGEADASGKWLVKLGPVPYGGPYDMEISGRADMVRLKNILIGDVWLCSGQSNMAFDFNNGRAKTRYADLIASSSNDNIRQVLIERRTASFPAADCHTSGWRSAGPASLSTFSCVAYFFALNLYKKTHVPVGLINSSYGGTIAEAWTSQSGIMDFPEHLPSLRALQDTFALSEKIKRSKESFVNWSVKVDPGPANGPAIDNGAEWKTVAQAGLWNDLGFPNTAGSFWYRKEIDLAEVSGRSDGVLELGQIDDKDITYFNGQFIGSGADRDVRRIYTIPKQMIRKGKNVILIKIISYGGRGGIMQPELMRFKAGGEVSLAGTWQVRQDVAMADRPQVYDPKNLPTSLFNGMIAPLVPYALKGVLWYQGEYNAGRAYAYRQQFPALINDWRRAWQKNDLPFIYAQLPNFQPLYDHPVESDWAELREAQAMTLSLPHTGMAVTIDLGEADDIHPVDKAGVGYRLALVARRTAYGDKHLNATGPVYRSMKINGDRIILRFDGAAPVVKGGGALKFFAIAGADRKFVWAKAVIRGKEVIVSDPAVSSPVAVRYAWAGNPSGCNLFSADGLPASPFRTDNWPGVTQ